MCEDGQQGAVTQILNCLAMGRHPACLGADGGQEGAVTRQCQVEVQFLT